MNAQTKIEPDGLALLRLPFPEHQISKLPKPTKAQTDAVKSDFKKGIRCKICGTWHHPDVVHLDYVGHAALTDRLLDCDMRWAWEPCVEPGLPNPGNGMWIKLTVCGVTRLGYGSADGKSGGDAVKEIIGDALRNAAMRFGAALDLWHKGDLHLADEGEIQAEVIPAASADEWGIRPKDGGPTKGDLDRILKDIVHEIEGCGDEDMLTTYTATDEYKQGKAALEEYRPSALYGPNPRHSPDFVPLRELVSRKVKLFRMGAENNSSILDAG